jgi:hypothetical protein
MWFILSYSNSLILNKKEKAPYEAKAAKRKIEYEKLMNAYNNKVSISHVSSSAIFLL